MSAAPKLEPAQTGVKIGIICWSLMGEIPTAKKDMPECWISAADAYRMSWERND